MIHNPCDLNVFQPYEQLGVAPAAGANYIVAAPAGRRSVLAILSFHFLADANVADRIMRIRVDGAIIDPYLVASATDVIANQGIYFQAHINNAHDITNTTPYRPLPLPNSPVFNSGDNLTISVAGIQAGDQISNIHMFWHCWPLGPA